MHAPLNELDGLRSGDASLASLPELLQLIPQKALVNYRQCSPR
jgi:hypothetical protein